MHCTLIPVEGIVSETGPTVKGENNTKANSLQITGTCENGQSSNIPFVLESDDEVERKFIVVKTTSLLYELITFRDNYLAFSGDFYRAILCIRGTSHGPVSVCPSVRQSVTSRCSTKTAKRRITQTTPHDTPGNLVY